MDYRRESTRRQSTFRRQSTRRQSTFRQESTRRQSTFRRESTRRQSTFRRESTRRQSTFRRESTRRQSTFRRESSRRQSAVRRQSTRRQSSFRRPSTRRQSSLKRSSSRRQITFRRPSPDKSSYHALEDEGTLTDSEDYDSDWDDDECSEMEGSEHTLSTTIKTNIQVERNGIGFILIQNGPYIQLSGIVNKSAAAKDGKLRSGDIFLKIGHANVLGWTLRELRQLFHTTPVGTVLQIQVYRDFMVLPSRWTNTLENIPELKGPDIRSSGETSEEEWTSSEDTDEAITGDDVVVRGCSRVAFGDEDINTAKPAAGVTSSSSHVVFGDEDDIICAKTVVTGAALSNRAAHTNTVLTNKVVQSFVFGPSNQPKWISKDWHIFERKTHTFTVGSDIGCDIMIHNDCDTKRDIDISRSSSPYWIMPKRNVEPSLASSSSTVSDVFWLEGYAYELE